MKSLPLKNHYLLFISTAIYTYLFWENALGINVFLFSLLLMLLLFMKHHNSFRSSPYVWVTLAGSLISGIMVVLNNTTNSIVIHLLSMILLTGFVHHAQLKSALFSLIAILQTYAMMPSNAIQDYMSTHETQRSKAGSVFYFFKLLIVPFLIVIVFAILYSISNSVFADFIGNFTAFVFDCFSKIFDYISFSALFFSLGGMAISGGIIYKHYSSKIEQEEQNENEFIVRKRKKHFFNKAINALTQEYRIALLMLVLVNILVLILNCIDIKYLWFGFVPQQGFCFKDFVHQGTELLIISILLAMFIVIYYFRNNLNFYPNNKWLRLLANLWMIQNLVLTISVGLRNYYYIYIHALAYKRIGVFFFLILVAIGLLSMLIKINQKRSTYFLLRINSWSVYILLIVLSCINWDETIVKFNIHHWNKKEVDVDFYYELSPRVSYYLYQNLPIIKEQIDGNQNEKHHWIENKTIEIFETTLIKRMENYNNETADYKCQSWNYADAKAINQLSKIFAK
ncbi:MAG: hypothetical protein RIQ33_117 [Bacteroidota bacterium]